MDRKVMIFKAFAFFISLMGMTCLTSCEKYVWVPVEVGEDVIISFSEHIYPLCNSCHTSWDVETAYNKLSSRVDTVNPAESSILTFHSSVVQTNMIEVNDTLSLRAADVIKLWASQGADNN